MKMEINFRCNGQCVRPFHQPVWQMQDFCCRSHNIQCMVSCMEEFEGSQGVWTFENYKWKWVQRQGYAERCKLKELLGANCVKHVKACFKSAK